MIPSIRQTNLLLFIGGVFTILAGAYMEHVMKMLPCPLCITQRAFFDLIGILGLIAFIHNPGTKGRRVYAVLGIIAALGGLYFAQHQLWLQSLPADQVPACGPGLAYMFEVFPLMEAFKMLLQGDGTCAHVDKILGLSIPLWSVIAFSGFGLINLYQAVRKG
ncbi:MAG: disulfide bond formation protein B [Moraxellaceae bacterium]|nr:MAG: disulfide bond formation protein B [Moraxellaceae bacterium]